MSEIYKNRYAAFNIDVHLVFITKHRKNVLDEGSHEYSVSVWLGYVSTLTLNEKNVMARPIIFT